MTQVDTTQEHEENPYYYMDEIYKQWHRSGFLSVRYWARVKIAQIEIGTIDPNSHNAKSVSKCYIDAYKFLTYLHAEVYGITNRIFPDFEEKEFQHFGGKMTADGPVARVFKSGYFKKHKDDTPDSSRRSFRCANYVGIPGKNGEMRPDYSKVISFNSIQMRFENIAELYHRLDKAMQSYEIQHADQVDVFDGKE